MLVCIVASEREGGGSSWIDSYTAPIHGSPTLCNVRVRAIMIAVL